MRVLVLVKATAESEAGLVADAEAMAAMGRFNDELRAAGVLLFADGLKPTGSGCRVWFEGAERTVQKGPFFPSEQQIAGLWLWEAKDMAEAIAWAKRCPNPMPGPSMIEIRPFYGSDELA